MNNFLNPYKHIIWDWNGTLIDDASLSVEIINHLLERRKMPAISPERYQDEFSIPVKEYYRRLGFDFSREPYEKLAEEFITEYEQRKFECSLQPQARALLEFFRQTGRGQSILTAYRQDKLQELLEYYSIRPFFTHLVGVADHLGGGKVEQGKGLLQMLPFPPQTLLMIGDTLHDSEVARTMGIDCILVPSGHQSPSRLAKSGAGRPVCTLAQFLG